MSGEYFDLHVQLDGGEHAGARPLTFSPYAPGGDTYGYDNRAYDASDYPGDGADGVYSFQATAGAVYSVEADGYSDPDALAVFDANGYAIAGAGGFGDPGSDHLVFVAPASGLYYVDAGPAQHGVALSILEDRGTLAANIIDGTNWSDTIDGTGDDDDLYGHAGNDSLFGGGGDDYLDGGAGIDAAFYNGRSTDYDVRWVGDRIEVTALATGEGIDMLSNIERLDFADVTVGLDIEGPSGQAFRLYHAAFDRDPDLVGLGYWIAQLDHGADLRDVAAGFAASAEFRALYGTSLDHQDLVLQLYHNVLHRAPDQAGVDYWTHLLDTAQVSLPEILVDFSESAENHAQLAAVVGDGIAFVPYA